MNQPQKLFAALYPFFLATFLQVVILPVCGLLRISSVLWRTCIVCVINLIIFGFLYRKSFGFGQTKQLKTIFGIRNLLLFFGIGVCGQIATSMMLNLILPLFPGLMNTYTHVMNQLNGPETALSLIVVVLLAPLSEELIFRGLLLKRLGTCMCSLAANFVQAFLFGFWHDNIVQGIYAFLFGLILGFTARSLHSVWPAVIIHSVLNACGLLLKSLLTRQIKAPIMAISGIVAILLCLIMVFQYKKPMEDK